MARRRNQRQKEANPAPQSVAHQLIYEARLGANGAVIQVPPPIDQAQAIAIRRSDGNVVVCGPDKTANSLRARDIEHAANGHWKRCKPHINAGPNALPHYQPDPRGQTIGHTFYETDTKHPL
jgi:hypothetical protein